MLSQNPTTITWAWQKNCKTAITGAAWQKKLQNNHHRGLAKKIAKQPSQGLGKKNCKTTITGAWQKKLQNNHHRGLAKKIAKQPSQWLGKKIAKQPSQGHGKKIAKQLLETDQKKNQNFISLLAAADPSSSICLTFAWKGTLGCPDLLSPAEVTLPLGVCR